MSALLTIAETAHALAVSTRTIRRLIADHQLRIVKVRGRPSRDWRKTVPSSASKHRTIV